MGITNFGRIVYCSDKFSYLEHSGIKDALSKETGRERVIRMFKKNDIGIMSPELRFIVKNCSAMYFVFGFYGAVVELNKEKHDFLRRNAATAFESQYKAKRSLVDSLSLAALKGCMQYAWKYGTFSALYLMSTMTIENYRNKMSIWEHAGTAAVLGGLSRWKYGVKGFFIASALGGVLGTAAGGLLMLNLYISGTSFEEFRYWQHEDYYTNFLKKKIE